MNKLVLSVILWILVGCQPKQDDSSLENQILDCFYQQHQEHGIDIKASIDSAKSILLNYGVLPDNEGRSYIEFIRAMNKAEDFPLETPPNLIEELKSIKYLPSGVQCTDMRKIDFDSIEFANSKLKDLANIYDLITGKGNISVAMITGEMLKIFDEKDFDHPYYQTLGILSISNLIKANDETGWANLQPPKPDHISSSDLATLTINLTADDRIKVENVEVSKDEAFQKIANFISKNEENHVISLKSKRATSYDFYELITDGLDEIYQEVRNRYAQQSYQKSYEQLDAVAKETVDKKIPKAISISEPEL